MKRADLKEGLVVAVGSRAAVLEGKRHVEKGVVMSVIREPERNKANVYAATTLDHSASPSEIANSLPRWIANSQVHDWAEYQGYRAQTEALEARAEAAWAVIESVGVRSSRRTGLPHLTVRRRGRYHAVCPETGLLFVSLSLRDIEKIARAIQASDKQEQDTESTHTVISE